MDEIDTSDPDEAGQALSKSFPDIQVETSIDGRPFRIRYSRTERGALAWTRLRVQGVLRTPGDYPDHLAVGRRRDGRVSIRYGDARLDTGRPYVRVPGRSIAEFDDSDVELVIVDRAAFSAIARRHLEGSGRVLRDPLPGEAGALSVEAARLWDACANLVVSTLSAPPSISDALLEEVVVAGALASFSLAEDASEGVGIHVLPRVIRRGTEFIDEHLDEPITVALIADAAHVSVRSLQAGFRQHLGTTPLRYLREARMRAAYEQLSAATPDETTVAAVGRRWGFAHASRFSSEFRRRFGEYPALTLRR